MPRRIEHTATYACSPAALHAALTTEEYWTARVQAVGGDAAALDSVTVAGGGIEVALTQVIAAKHLPSIIGKIKSGDLEISRTESWGPLQADAATGSVTARVNGTPARVRGASSLTGDDGSATVRTTAEATVAVPLIGGKIEQAVADNVTALLMAEQRFTQQWLAQR